MTEDEAGSMPRSPRITGTTYRDANGVLWAKASCSECRCTTTIRLGRGPEMDIAKRAALVACFRELHAEGCKHVRIEGRPN
jgi:hypothetical protein